MHLLEDDDVRVREHTAACLCRFIIQNGKQKLNTKILQTHQNLTASFQPKISGYNNNNSSSSSKSNLTTFSSDNQQNSKKSFVMETLPTNFNLLWDFFDYRIFYGMSLPLRNLFKTNSAFLSSVTGDSMEDNNSNSNNFGNICMSSIEINAHTELLMHRQIEQEEKVLAKVLYRLTNKLMTLSNKNMQVSLFLVYIL